VPRPITMPGAKAAPPTGVCTGSQNRRHRLHVAAFGSFARAGNGRRPHTPCPHTGPWGVVRGRCCVCLAPPLRSLAPLPPPADHAQGDEGEEGGRGFGDRLHAAKYRRHERIDIEAQPTLTRHAGRSAPAKKRSCSTSTFSALSSLLTLRSWFAIPHHPTGWRLRSGSRCRGSCGYGWDAGGPARSCCATW
jgi:hypothetical protein